VKRRRLRRLGIALLAGLALYAVPQVVVALLALAYFGTFALALFTMFATGADPYPNTLPGERAAGAYIRSLDRDELADLASRHDD
jgi:hypothetical protein